MPRVMVRRGPPLSTRLSATLVALAVAPAVSAEPTPPPPPALAPAASAAALGAVATRLAAELSGAPPGALVVASPLHSDDPAPRGAELVARVASIVAGALGNGASSRPEPMSLAAARNAGRHAGGIVYVQVEIVRGELRVTADGYVVPTNVWERVRRPEPPSSAHAFASARIDAEVRGFLAPVPLVAGKIDRATSEDRDVVAIGCGDADDDGALELITVGRRRVATGRLRAGKFVTLHAASWSELSPVAPAPLREPIGAVALVPRGDERGSFIDVGLTDRARGVRFDAALRPLAPLAGVPIGNGDGDLCARFIAGAAAPELAKCTPSDPALDFGPVGPADTLAAGAVVTARGAPVTVVAARDPATGEVRLFSGEATATLSGAGAQLAIADLDGDGDPEIVYGADVLAPAEDALVISSWHPGEPVRERVRLAVPAGVRAVAVCPPVGGGAAPIAIATASAEVWVVR